MTLVLNWIVRLTLYSDKFTMKLDRKNTHDLMRFTNFAVRLAGLMKMSKQNTNL